MSFTSLQRTALEFPSARAVQVTPGGSGEHFQDVISPYGEDGRVGLTVNR